MVKADFKKSLDCHQAREGEFHILEVPPMRYLMIDGHGDPNSSQEFADAVQTLYPVAYKLKFTSKQDLGRDYASCPWRVCGGQKAWRRSRDCQGPVSQGLDDDVHDARLDHR